MTGIRAIPLLDLSAQYAQIRDEVLCEIERVLDTQELILGEDVRILEQSLAAYTGARGAVGCASGSDALLLALLALDLKPGDRVLTTPYTFFATAGAISHAHAVPVFADIDPVTFNLDPEQAVAAISGDARIRAVIPVHLFGGAADLDPLLGAARERNVSVIEDAAQALGAEYKGRRVGSAGDFGCFSFYPTKNLGAFGDGGLVTVESPELERRLRALRMHGRTGTYLHDWVGLNSRLDTVQAAVLNVKFRYLDHWTEGRRGNAALYTELLTRTELPVTPPRCAEFQTRHVFNQYVIRCRERDRLRAFLTENGISTGIYYPLPLHLQNCYRELGYREGDFPESEKAARESLALPVYPELAVSDIERICDCIRGFHG